MFRGMEYVYEVYKEKSFSKAAKNLFISQPSLSANIRRVEEKIGYPIFDRSTKPLGLTEPGEKYIRSIEQILAVENEYADFINDWGGLKTGSLTLGGSNLFSSWILPSLMGTFARKYPMVSLTLVEEATSRLEKMLMDGSVDVMIDYRLAEEDVFERRLFRREHLVLAVPGYLAAGKQLERYEISVEQIRTEEYLNEQIPAVPLAVFREDPFIMLKPDNDTRKFGVRICQSYGFLPHIVLELDQQMTAYNVASSGMGIAFIGDTLVQKVPENPRLVYYKLPLEVSGRGLYFYWKSGRYQSRAMEEFLRLACGEER